ncbi:MAG: nucleotide-binding protein [Firmicutes bacterium]|nr:nucleotide-binding protein [Bacillota bacterium]
MLKLFIGSTVEALKYAEALQSILVHDFEVTIWNQGVFTPGYSNLESLVSAIYGFDCAIFFFTCDDVVAKRDNIQNSVRDNILFEYGLFMGALGRDRVWFAYDLNDDVSNLPTDIAGVCPMPFHSHNKNISSAVGVIATNIKQRAASFSINIKEFEKLENDKDYKKFIERKNEFLFYIKKFISKPKKNVLLNDSLKDEIYFAIAVDVDKFEAINRMYGVNTGDAIITELKKIFNERMRFLKCTDILTQCFIEYHIDLLDNDEFFIILKFNISQEPKIASYRIAENTYERSMTLTEDYNRLLAQLKSNTNEDICEKPTTKHLKRNWEAHGILEEMNAFLCNVINKVVNIKDGEIKDSVQHLKDLLEKAMCSAVPELIDKTKSYETFLFHSLESIYNQRTQELFDLVKSVADDLIGSVAKYDWDQYAKDLYVTCSSGIALKNDDEPVEKWLSRSLHGVKIAKKNGGNQTERAPVELAYNQVYTLENHSSDSSYVSKRFVRNKMRL